VLAHVKSNVSALAASLSYEVESVVLPGDDRVETARLRLNGESDHSGHDLLDAPRGEERSALDEAIEFLSAELSDGERESREVRAAARAAGVSDRTLDRAKRELRVDAQRVGGAAAAGYWIWTLPNGAKGKDASPISQVGALSAKAHSNGENEAAPTLSAPAETYGALSSEYHPLCSCFRPGEVMSDGRCGRCFGHVSPDWRGAR
jgi:hypothetical protein